MPLSDQSTPSLTPSPSRSPSPMLPIQPDHFYSPDGERLTPSSPDSTYRVWLSPDDDPFATKGIPVFKPSMEEFVDFEALVGRIECWGMRSGIVKVIPPKEWKDALPSVVPQLSSVRIKSPIEQHMLGRSGLYRQQNIEKRKAISVREWAELCAKEEYRAPAVDEVGLKAGGEHAADSKRKSKPRRMDTEKLDMDVEPIIVRDGVADGEEESHPVPEHDHIGVPPAMDALLSPEDAGTTKDGNEADDAEEPSSVPRKRRYQTRAEREAALQKRAELDEAFLKTFDPQTYWLPPNTSASDYTPGFCAKLERRYWRNCGLSKPAWYGADTSGTLFTDATTCWNVSCLPSTLSRLLSSNQNGLPGVNTPYLYFGMWRATFAWHVEDMDLFSINYNHFGAPKFWYAIPQARAVQLENTLRSLFPRDAAQCRQFLRHKSFLASPTLLAQNSCKPNTLVQRAGEFVITFPRGYHAGFNLGLNCAESVNFALESWLDIGRKAQACGCIGDSVRIDVDALLQEQEEEARLERAKVARSKKRKSALSDGASDKDKTSRKRKSDGVDHGKLKKIKIKLESVTTSEEPRMLASPSKKVVLKVSKDGGPFPCCLCVSYDMANLLPVHDSPSAWAGCQNVPPKEANGSEIWRAHESCALVVPETWVDEVVTHLVGDDGERVKKIEKVIFGVDAIVKDRWALKCTACLKTRAKAHGAPIQCTKGKCPKAFHVSCAREGGNGECRVHFAELRSVEKEVVLNEAILLEESNKLDAQLDALQSTDEPLLPMPIDAGSNADERPRTLRPDVVKIIKKTEYELLCTQHNPVVAATKRANKLDRIRNELLALPSMSRIKLRVSAGVFEVSLVSVNEERNTVEVIWDDGIKREFKWSSLVWGKTEGQTIGQKPTVAALPAEQRMDASNLNAGYSQLQANYQAALAAGLEGANGHGGYQTYGYGSGQYPYGTGTYAYYSPVANPASSLATGASTSQAAYGEVPSLPYFRHPMTFRAHYGSPNQGTPSPPSVPPIYSMFSVSNAKPRASPFSQAFQQTLASSVAALPPRTNFPDTVAQMASQTRDVSPVSAPAPAPALVQTSQSSADAASSSSSTLASRNDMGPSARPQSTVQKQQQKENDNSESSAMPMTTTASPTSAAATAKNTLPPDILKAIEELQSLTSLGPEELQQTLSARPSLREAVKRLLAHQAFQPSASAATA